MLHARRGAVARMSDPRKPLLQVPLHEPFHAAVKLGAAHNFTTVSDYVRRALLSQLRADGLDPHTEAPLSCQTGVGRHAAV